jgi:hypothetical protein
MQLLYRFRGQTLTVGRLVVENRDLRIAPVIGQIIAGDQTLLVIASAHAKHIGAAFIGQYRARRGRRDHDDIGFLINF